MFSAVNAVSRRGRLIGTSSLMRQEVLAVYRYYVANIQDYLSTGGVNDAGVRVNKNRYFGDRVGSL